MGVKVIYNVVDLDGYIISSVEKYNQVYVPNKNEFVYLDNNEEKFFISKRIFNVDTNTVILTCIKYK